MVSLKLPNIPAVFQLKTFWYIVSTSIVAMPDTDQGNGHLRSAYFTKPIKLDPKAADITWD